MNVDAYCAFSVVRWVVTAVGVVRAILESGGLGGYAGCRMKLVLWFGETSSGERGGVVGDGT